MEYNEYLVNTILSCSVVMFFLIVCLIAVFFTSLYVYKIALKREEKTKRVVITEEKECDSK